MRKDGKNNRIEDIKEDHSRVSVKYFLREEHEDQTQRTRRENIVNVLTVNL